MFLKRPSTTRSRLRQLLSDLLSGRETPEDPKRGRLLLEALEKRQLMAGDVELLFTAGGTEQESSIQTNVQATASQAIIPVAGQAEGELAPDLVQFAKNLTAAGVKFFGAGWCPFCTQQKELFQDGQKYLPFIEVTNSDRTLNSIGQAENITTFPTWKFPGVAQPSTGVLTLQQISELSGVPIPQGEDPTFKPIGNATVQIGSPLHIPVDAYDPDGGPLTVTVSVANPSLLQAVVLSGNRSIRVDMQGYGDMVFELFEQRAPVASGRVIELANSGFYDGIIFHRIADDFVIQAGDPTGTGTSGSTLGNFDDDFHPELQHNREGVLSFAKSSDDTNNSQFFITEVPTRFLDFNHSIFGQLVEGFDVRESISETSTPESRSAGSSQKPDNEVKITSIDVFDDTENAVVMLKAAGTATGTTSVTFTVTDQDGNSHSETIQVAVVADGSNSQPFLNDITTPTAKPINTPSTLQLSSVDIEGDAVTYFAQSLSNASSGTVAVDANTGLVTVTPATGFAGTINVRVGVRPQNPTATGNSQSDSDTQTVAFAFQGESVVAPTSVDLQAASDSGSNNTDNITNAGTMSFLVSGVTSGATVQLVIAGSNAVVGTGQATGSTIVISTNNIAALGDGAYQIVARQINGTNTSPVSPALALTYDSTSPASVVSSAATQANVGRPYQTDLVSTEEGSGLVYALTTAPTGATINASTGVINWTPAANQLGANAFTVELTDRAGNKRSEGFSVNVSAAPTAEIRLEVTNLQGAPLTSISVGQEFLLRMVAVDARSFSKPGVFGAYADILFDNNLVRPVDGTPIQHADGFGVVRKGTVATGLIDELGAVNSTLAPTNLPENLIATVRMRAVAAGTANIRSEPADESNSEFLLFGIDDQLPASAVAYGSVSLAVGQSFTVQNDSVTFAEDSAKQTINVLQNDQVITGGGALTVVAVTQPTSGGVVSLDAGVVSFTPTANFNGVSTFTYRVSDSQGIQETATVTVTVTPVNDPPTGVNDTLNVNRNAAETFLNVLANDVTTPDAGETLRVVAVGASSQGGLVTIATNGTGINYRPATGFTGTDTFTYTVSDGGLQQVVTVNVVVAIPDNAPTAVNDSFTLQEDAAEASFDVLTNDTKDLDNQTFVIDSLGVPSAGGSVRIAGNGTQFFYEPKDNFSGTETVTYTIRDTGGGLAVGTVTFTVTAVNDAPPIANPTIGFNRGSSNAVVFSRTDLPANVDSGETLTLELVATATSAGGTATLNATQQISYTPAANFVGTDTISYRVKDGSTLVSTGTITIQVSNFTQREITLTLPSLPAITMFPGIKLIGTNLLGDAVNVPLQFTNNTASFKNLLPGDYSIQIPSIPFLQNASEARTIPVNSGDSEGNETVASGLGRLRPEYVSIRDWLGSAPRQSVLAVVAAGQSSELVTASSAANLTSPAVSLDGSGNLLTITGTRSQTATNGTTTQNQVQTTVATNNSRAELRGQVGTMRLYRIATEGLTFTNVPAASSAIPSSLTAEGEQFVAASSSVIPVGSQAEGERVVSDNSLTIGDSQSVEDSIASAAVTQADLFVPVSNLVSTRSDATVLSLEDGDLWVGQSLREVAPSGDESSTISDSSGSASTIDSAMQVVAEDLTIISEAGDALAEQSAQDQELRARLIDDVLSSAL